MPSTSTDSQAHSTTSTESGQSIKAKLPTTTTAGPLVTTASASVSGSVYITSRVVNSVAVVGVSAQGLREERLRNEIRQLLK